MHGWILRLHEYCEFRISHPRGGAMKASYEVFKKPSTSTECAELVFQIAKIAASPYSRVIVDQYLETIREGKTILPYPKQTGRPSLHRVLVAAKRGWLDPRNPISGLPEETHQLWEELLSPGKPAATPWSPGQFGRLYLELRNVIHEAVRTAEVATGEERLQLLSAIGDPDLLAVIAYYAAIDPTGLDAEDFMSLRDRGRGSEIDVTRLRLLGAQDQSDGINRYQKAIHRLEDRIRAILGQHQSDAA